MSDEREKYEYPTTGQFWPTEAFGWMWTDIVDLHKRVTKIEAEKETLETENTELKRRLTTLEKSNGNKRTTTRK